MHMYATLLLAALPFGYANPLASTFAGETVTAVYPPPGATGTALDAYFPDASEVGYAGPTPTGDEAEAIQTAPAASPMDSIFPLIDSAPLGPKTSDFDVLRSLGSLGPLYSVASQGLPQASPQIPEGCSINQVHLLQRHGARYPSSGGSGLATALNGAATGAGFNATGPVEFLNTWTYKLGAEILTPFGREQLFQLGVGFRMKYGELLKGFTELPVWRTTSEARMVDSALHFAAGFFGVQTYQSDYNQVIMIESDDFNNTLGPYAACPISTTDAVGNYGETMSTLWIETYLQPAVDRINSLIQGVNLTIWDVLEMQDLCAYETVALGFSDFCGVFTQEEWEGYEYSSDLAFWYSEGPGNPASAALGVGWVAELVARLTQTPITAAIGEVNTTLANNITLPLYQPIFVDATHDSVIANILTTMNFTSLAANGPLPTDHIPANRSYIVSEITPFASNLVGQVLSCPASNVSTHIRWILNDAVLPLTGLGSCPEDPNGLCELSTFITSMQARIDEIDFSYDCFANYTVPDPDNIIDGRYPASLRNGTV